MGAGTSRPQLRDLIQQPGTTVATGDSDVIDPQGSSYAATDGDPGTVWTAPQDSVQRLHLPSLVIKLPKPTAIGAIRLRPSRTEVPAHPKQVAINLGDGPQLRSIDPKADVTELALHPSITDTITVTVTDWTDIIDRTALGLDQLKPPGIAEVVALNANHRPIAPADNAANSKRKITIGCDRGPILALAGRFVPMSITATVRELLDGTVIQATPCDTSPIATGAGIQDVTVNPSQQFIVDGVQLTAATTEPASATMTVTPKGAWGPDRREVTAEPSTHERVLAVPESINPGWAARDAQGHLLTPVRVNGWQQGWVLPAGDGGKITLTFGLNTWYRAGLFGGLALLPILACLALLPARGRTTLPPWPLARGPGRRCRGIGCAHRDQRYLGDGRRPGSAGVQGLDSMATTRGHRRRGVPRGWLAAAGRCSSLTAPVALGGRLHRPLVVDSAAGADLGGLRGIGGGTPAITSLLEAAQRLREGDSTSA